MQLACDSFAFCFVSAAPGGATWNRVVEDPTKVDASVGVAFLSASSISSASGKISIPAPSKASSQASWVSLLSAAREMPEGGEGRRGGESEREGEEVVIWALVEITAGHHY